LIEAEALCGEFKIGAGAGFNARMERQQLTVLT
jgi:hypothetical protein